MAALYFLNRPQKVSRILQVTSPHTGVIFVYDQPHDPRSKKSSRSLVIGMRCSGECPENGGMTTREVRSVGSIADRGNGDAMGVAVDYDGG
jgi:hypothetical protein